MTALVTSEIFRVFVNTLTPDVKYYPRNMQFFLTTISNAIISKKKRLFVDFWLYFWNVHEIENILKKRRVS